MKEAIGDTAEAPGLTEVSAGTSHAGRRLRAWWSAALGVVGTVLGLVPHILHHVGLIAGTAVIAGSGGTIVFGVVGLVASIPLLLRLRRRFGSRWAPIVGLAVFAVMFSLSAFVIGPAITGDAGQTPEPDPPSPPADHTEHHN